MLRRRASPTGARVYPTATRIRQDGHSEFVIVRENNESTSKHKVGIRAPATDDLSALSFAGASRRNKPALEMRSLVYAWVEHVQPHHAELSCVDPETKNAWNIGEVLLVAVMEGLTVEATLDAAQRMLSGDGFVLDR